MVEVHVLSHSRTRISGIVPERWLDCDQKFHSGCRSFCSLSWLSVATIQKFSRVEIDILIETGVPNLEPLVVVVVVDIIVHRFVSPPPTMASLSSIRGIPQVVGMMIQTVIQIAGEGSVGLFALMHRLLGAMIRCEYWHWLRTHAPARRVLAWIVRQPPVVLLWGLRLMSAFLLWRQVRSSSSPTRRALVFWYHVGPLLWHYQLTDWTLCWAAVITNHPQQQQRRESAFQQLHQRYAPTVARLLLQDLDDLYTILVTHILSSSSSSSWLWSRHRGLPVSLDRFVPEHYRNEFSRHLQRMMEEDGEGGYALDQWSLVEMERVVQDSLNQTHNLEFRNVFDGMLYTTVPPEHLLLHQEEDDMDMEDNDNNVTTTTMMITSTNTRSISVPPQLPYYYYHPVQTFQATLTDSWSERRNLGDVENPSVTIQVLHLQTRQRLTQDLQVVNWFCRIVRRMPLLLLRNQERHGVEWMLDHWKQWQLILPLLDNNDDDKRMIHVDYRQECQILDELYQCVQRSPYSDYVALPRPVSELSCDNWSWNDWKDDILVVVVLETAERMGMESTPPNLFEHCSMPWKRACPRHWMGIGEKLWSFWKKNNNIKRNNINHNPPCCYQSWFCLKNGYDLITDFA